MVKPRRDRNGVHNSKGGTNLSVFVRRDVRPLEFSLTTSGATTDRFEHVPTRRRGAVDDEEGETGNTEFLTGHESVKTARIKFTAPPSVRHVFSKAGDSDADVHNVCISKPVCKKRESVVHQ